MKQFYLILSLSIFLLLGCKSKGTKIFINDKIKNTVKKEIKERNDIFLKSIKVRDEALLLSLMCDKLKDENTEYIKNILEVANTIIFGNSYTLLDQYYVINSKLEINNTVSPTIKDRNYYEFTYLAVNKEMVTSLLIPKGGVDEYLLTLVYGKYPDGWKINILQFGRYKINKKTAVEWYDLAVKEYPKGKLVKAINNIYLANQCVNPANIFWKYPSGDSIKYLYERFKTESNEKFKFPRVIDKVDSKPEVFDIFPFAANESYYPMVHYLTYIDLSDTAALAIENELVHANINAVFEGINDDGYTFYRAFNEIGDGTSPIGNYGFVQNNLPQE